jgi:hypothetical protein
MKRKQELCYVYLQPISISAGEGNKGHIFAGENYLKVEGPIVACSPCQRTPLKFREIIKVNKEFKVYNKIIHFYNFLYMVEISKTAEESIME